MDDDWDVDEPSSSTSPAAATPPPPVAQRAPARGRFAGEDEEDEQDDWDASEDEKPKAAATTAAAAPAKKKMTLKQKLAEKERLASEAKANGSSHGDDDDLIETTTEQERRRMARERELEADLATAADLMGATGVEDTADAIKTLLTAKPSTKNDFALYSKTLMSALISRHESNPLYSAFVEQFAKDLSESLSAVQTRKVASALTVLGNTKQQEERDKASGKKKPAAGKKAAIVGSTKGVNKVDLDAYDDVLDDGDFM